MSVAPDLFSCFAERQIRARAGAMIAGLSGYGASSARPAPPAVGAAHGHRRAANDAAR
jgi:hypothetical protein